MKSATIRFRVYLSLCCALLLAACGGGGGGGGADSSGGGGNPPAPTGITYTGSTTPATLTSGNAGTMADSAYQGTTPGQTAGGAALNTTRPEHRGLVGLADALARAGIGAGDSTAQSSATSRAIANFTGTLQGTCNGLPQGTASGISGTYDNVTGAFTATVTLINFRACDGTLNGSATVTGNIDIATGWLKDFILSFTTLTYTEASYNWTLSGSIAYASPVFSGNRTTTINLTYLDNTTSKVYKIENLVLVFTENGPADNVTINGRFYHPDHGYVDLTTTVPITLTYVSRFPTQGTLVLTGQGNRKVRITFVFNGTYSYNLGLDANGDGTYEQTATCSWVTGCGAFTP